MQAMVMADMQLKNEYKERWFYSKKNVLFQFVLSDFNIKQL